MHRHTDKQGHCTRQVMTLSEKEMTASDKDRDDKEKMRGGANRKNWKTPTHTGMKARYVWMKKKRDENLNSAATEESISANYLDMRGKERRTYKRLCIK